MTGEGPATDGRISLSLRVGVTGHRWLDPADAALLATVTTALERLRAACTVSATTATRVGLTVVSSLAEGADRIVAEAALALGARLEVVLPLPVDDFADDFADDASRTRFAQLLGRASSVTTVPGNLARPDAYVASGEMVLDRCDAVLALWDGRPARGRGGTAEVVDAAGAAEKPITWIEVSPPGGTGPSAPVIKQAPRQVVIMSSAAYRSLDRYNRQRVPAGDSDLPPEGFPQSGEAAAFVLPYFLRADRIATHRQKMFRRASTLLYALSVVAIVAPAMQLVYFEGEQRGLTWLEVGALIVVIGVLLLGRRTLLLERWLAARFLAERLRSLAFLAELSAGESLQTPATDDVDRTPSDEWRERAMSELSIRAPRPTVDPRVLFRTASARLCEEWLRPQVAYHQKVSFTATRRYRQFKWVAVVLFGVSVAAALVHLTELVSTKYADAVFVALVVPTVAAALSGYSAQRDFPRIAIRSRSMVRSLTTAIGDVQRTTTVDELRAVAQRVDIVMQGESVDWYAAARLREPEVP